MLFIGLFITWDIAWNTFEWLGGFYQKGFVFFPIFYNFFFLKMMIFGVLFTFYLEFCMLVLMIGDSNRVLFVVVDDFKNEWRYGSEARRRVVSSSLNSHIWVRKFATSRGFLGTIRRFLPRVVAHWRRLVAFDGYAFCLFSRGFLTVIWVSWSPSIF